MNTPFTLEGKLALVTGAGTGIGHGIARVLGKLGADVALHYWDYGDGALAAVEEIKSLGRRAVAIQGDLTQVADCRRVSGRTGCPGEQRRDHYRRQLPRSDGRAVQHLLQSEYSW